MKKTFIFAVLLFTSNPGAAVVKSAPLVSIPTHDVFFHQIKNHCGKAYEGKVVVDHPKSEGFDDRLVMHVRKCTETELQIPFHVGDNRSRTWILTKTGSGLSLKHDHRKSDGADDPSTMYGGHTVDAGFDSAQSFPADQYSKELFVKQGIPHVTGNVWRVFVNAKTFTYMLVREGREFRLEFDLTKPVKAPPTPWGYR